MSSTPLGCDAHEAVFLLNTWLLVSVGNRHVNHVGWCTWNWHGFGTVTVTPLAKLAWENWFLIAVDSGGLWAWVGRLADPHAPQTISGLPVHFTTAIADPGLNWRYCR